MTDTELYSVFHTYLSYNQNTGEMRWKKPTSTKSRIKVGDIAGSVSMHGYRTVKIKQKPYLIHRIAWMMVHKTLPPFLDHINHNRLDNRLCNLRPATVKENGRNRSINKNNTSGCTGVYWFAARKKWKVSIKVNGKNKSLGHFKILKDAIAARKAAETEYGYHPNHGT